MPHCMYTASLDYAVPPLLSFQCNLVEAQILRNMYKQQRTMSLQYVCLYREQLPPYSVFRYTKICVMA